MNNLDDPILRDFRKIDAINDDSREGESTWNLLVQILLPLVLLLTFVVVSEIFFYKGAYKRMVEIMMAQDEFNPDELLSHQRSIIDAQYQSLLLALEKTRKREESRIKLSMFPDAQFISRNGVEISDSNFKTLCGEANIIFRDNQHYLNEIYQIVLDSAKVIDGSIIRVQKWTEKQIAAVEKSIEDVTAAQRSIIYTGNRKKIHNAIYRFSEGLQGTTVTLQEQIIKLLFQYLIENPENLDERASAMADQLFNLQLDEVERGKIANDLYKSITQRWRLKLNDEGYIFLDESWDKLQFLNNIKQ